MSKHLLQQTALSWAVLLARQQATATPQLASSHFNSPTPKTAKPCAHLQAPLSMHQCRRVEYQADAHTMRSCMKGQVCFCMHARLLAASFGQRLHVLVSG